MSEQDSEREKVSLDSALNERTQGGPPEADAEEVPLDRATKRLKAPSFTDSRERDSGIALDLQKAKFRSSAKFGYMLCGALLFIILWHIVMVACHSNTIAVGPKEKADLAKEAIAAINDTAKTLYAVISPLLAAVAGFFFSESRDLSK